MGFDIHTRGEKRIGGKWKAIGKEFVSSMYDKDSEYFSQEQFQHTAEPFAERSYDTFAILADVRNGSGFAGCVTGSGFKYISEPRGLPDDIDIKGHLEITPDEYAQDGEDGEIYFGDHSHSWLTLAEIIGFDWNQETHKSGWINGPTRKKLLESGDKWPSNWCGGISGGKVEHVSLALLDSRLGEGEICQDVYAEYTWPIAYHESCKTFLTKTVPSLEKIATDEGLTPDDIRIVFGFDS